MSLEAGIVGLPNVGKSTIFNALSGASVPMDNYPFCTIKENHAVVAVPDPLLHELGSILQKAEPIPARVDIVDIAGLVKGASENQGMGNQFLDHIRNVDALVHVVRCFDDGNIVHVEGSVDPLRDIDIIRTELVLADLAVLEKAADRNRRLAGSGDKKAKQALEHIESIMDYLNNEQDPPYNENEALRETARELNLLSAKRSLYVGNIDDSIASTEQFNIIEKWARDRGEEAIPFMARMEIDIRELDPSEQEEYRQELELGESGMDAFIHGIYRLLDLQSYYTAATDLQAWAIPRGTRALEAAGMIHTDFAEKFIRAEVFSARDLTSYGSEHALRDKGLVRTEGKDYVISEGDVVRYIINQ